MDVVSYFEASVTGAIEEDFWGHATFATFVDPETGKDALLLQFGTGGNVQRSISLTGRFDDVPSTGIYDVVALEDEYDEEFENAFDALELGELVGGFFTIAGAEGSEEYVSVVGYLEISETSSEVLEGEFEFTARRVEDESGGNGENGENDEPLHVQVVGIFTATRGEVEF